MALRQSRVVENLLCDNDMANGRPVESQVNPTITDKNITKSEPLSNGEQQRHRSIDGSLIYLAVKTRPDICLAASMLGAYVESSTKLALVAAKHVVRYIKGTLDMSMILHTGDGTHLGAFVDSSWGSNSERRPRRR